MSGASGLLRALRTHTGLHSPGSCPNHEQSSEPNRQTKIYAQNKLSRDAIAFHNTRKPLSGTVKSAEVTTIPRVHSHQYGRDSR
jgi:hypothetical protein